MLGNPANTFRIWPHLTTQPPSWPELLQGRPVWSHSFSPCPPTISSTQQPEQSFKDISQTIDSSAQSPPNVLIANRVKAKIYAIPLGPAGCPVILPDLTCHHSVPLPLPCSTQFGSHNSAAVSSKTKVLFPLPDCGGCAKSFANFTAAWRPPWALGFWFAKRS